MHVNEYQNIDPSWSNNSSSSGFIDSFASEDDLRELNDEIFTKRNVLCFVYRLLSAGPIDFRTRAIKVE